MANNPHHPHRKSRSRSRDELMGVSDVYPTPGPDWEEIVHYGWDDFCMVLDCPANMSTMNPCARCRTYGRMATDEEQAARKAELDAWQRQYRTDRET